ncbi:MAG: succinate dehydrogenase, cytochrome b556 subunit [Proteobacteria bacterium]|nr:succinate dehydrogenase, cytochrome b556 subunit [Pseudomonadota bacterium]
MQNHSRPVFLNLFLIHLPVTGVVSIIHRVTGVLWVLLLPVLAYVLHRSLVSETGFQWVVSLWANDAVRLLVFVNLLALLQHFYSGVRHLLLDLDVGITLPVARFSAWLCFVATALSAGWLGVCWW